MTCRLTTESLFTLSSLPSTEWPCLIAAGVTNCSPYIGGTVKDHQAVLLEAGGIEDHIHLLMKLHPQFAISSTLQLLKANSSRWINEHRKTPLRFQWQRGYGAFSVSQSMVSTVKQYIANQREHHLTQNFKQEYLQLLRSHEVEFDERYVFEQEAMGWLKHQHSRRLPHLASAWPTDCYG